ncbi:ABC transporter ATP-binding protein [Rapidithrix thailandica]|uniref:ABC transporter ATP-binding protein n=1 Tax=Rapidithrix thailandica TaxID=413964 RepID=A0AAW9S5U2_9BACT
MIKLHHITKNYTLGKDKVEALGPISLEVGAGEFVLIKGPSGCGKTTLLLALGGMLHPSGGSVEVAGQNLYELSEKERARFRGEQIGFVFQMFHLLPYLTVLENVLLSKKQQPAINRDKAVELLIQLNIQNRLNHTPAELSAGEKQRTALARAILKQPKLILADEPTGNLDPETGQEVVRYLARYSQQGGTVVMVTHGDQADALATRIIRLKNGKVTEDRRNTGISIERSVKK